METLLCVLRTQVNMTLVFYKRNAVKTKKK